MALIDEAYRRVRQSKKRLADLIEQMDKLREGEVTQIYVSRPRSDPHQFNYPVCEALDDLGTGAGECLQHLPVALNHLVSALVTARGHTVDQNLQFPVCHTPEAFRHRVASELRGVGGKEVALIEGFQPYKGNQWLARLNDLTRLGRHQVPLRLSTNSRTSISMHATSHLEATAPRGIRVLMPNSMDVK